MRKGDFFLNQSKRRRNDAEMVYASHPLMLWVGTAL
jgi:hypothetical protein